MNDLYLTRGDTGFYKFIRRDCDKEPISAMPDTLFFTVKNSDMSDNIILQKALNDGITYSEEDKTWHVKIPAGDTKNMQYGIYYYDIQVTTGEYVKTIAKGAFHIVSEITF